MKTYRITFGLLCSVLLSLLVMLSSCNDNDDDDDGPATPTADIVTFKDAALTGSQEVPPVTTQATGTFKGSYDKNTNRISYTITFQGITPIEMHFHSGAVGVDGPAIVPINPGSDPYSGSNPFISPLVGTTAPITEAQEAELLAGNWYINIHSDQFREGEIRGQITQ
ncbi:CHRD domain-containing protein [Pontibacter vulgaris]|uniref:CHRD domain-containing protein n=1 Tax=Pontibacter vulgaris TaxID=2905679 RepID=UPI001FA70042|nr:CHRD domain-containing protein [Pontibacter vulgaris]